MKKINQIISEEIKKFLVTENINSLSQYSNELQKYANIIGNINTNSLHPNVGRFIYDFERYILQIIFAIQRCVQNNSLNEGYYGGFMRLPNMRDMGLNIPPELGGNFVNDFVAGYRGTKNFLRGMRGYGRYGNQATNNRKNNFMNTNQNTLKTVKLSILLSQYQQWQRKYMYLNQHYQTSQYLARQFNGNDPIYESFDIIEKINNEYTQLKNAQGTNP
jgi:hypothetical protein